MSEVGRLDTSGKTLKNWAPERPENWDAKIAWSTLIITTFSMIPLCHTSCVDISTGKDVWL